MASLLTDTFNVFEESSHAGNMICGLKILTYILWVCHEVPKKLITILQRLRKSMHFYIGVSFWLTDLTQNWLWWTSNFLSLPSLNMCPKTKNCGIDLYGFSIALWNKYKAIWKQSGKASIHHPGHYSKAIQLWLLDGFVDCF